jgi:hypothetical protein
MVEKNDMIKKKRNNKEKKRKTLKIYRSSDDKTLSITEKILTRWILIPWKTNFKANGESRALDSIPSPFLKLVFIVFMDLSCRYFSNNTRSFIIRALIYHWRLVLFSFLVNYFFKLCWFAKYFLIVLASEKTQEPGLKQRQL